MKDIMTFECYELCGIKIKKGFTSQKFSDKYALCKTGNRRQCSNEVPSKLKE